MPRIITQKDFARNRRLTFCYLCGHAFAPDDSTDNDHCPPKAIFNAVDRANYPIVLRVHKQCNHEWHLRDDMLSLLFDPLSRQGKARKAEHRKRMEKREVNVLFQGLTLSGYVDLPLRPFATRLTQCMHAILYREWLPFDTPCDFMFPFAEANAEGRFVSDEIREVSLAMSKRIASSVKAGTYDFVTAYRNKFKYVCCWSTFDSGTPMCLVAFDIMNMARMAVPVGVLPRAVVGFYAGTPPQSDYSKATELELSLTEDEILYPLPI